jgi:hypothetical protein
MPMHDWTRIPPGIYHDFHGGWIYAIRGALNSGLLPKGYYALAEQVTRTIGPDVLTLHNPAANGSANGTGNGAPQGGANERGGVAVATLPKAQIEAKAERIVPPANRQLSIRHVSDHRMVAMIELVSPGNKASTGEFDSFVGKARTVLNEGIHLQRRPRGHLGCNDRTAVHTPGGQAADPGVVLLWRGRHHCLRRSDRSR